MKSALYQNFSHFTTVINTEFVNINLVIYTCTCTDVRHVNMFDNEY